MSSNKWPTFVDETLVSIETSDVSQDLFIEKDGVSYAGTHIILDCWEASHLDNISHIEKAIREAVDVCGATLLHIHLHHFTPNGGVSGVAVLAESHISIHTWPERDYAALDIFMCGETQPEKAIPVFEKYFETTNTVVNTHLRGALSQSDHNQNNTQASNTP